MIQVSLRAIENRIVAHASVNELHHQTVTRVPLFVRARNCHNARIGQTDIHQMIVCGDRVFKNRPLNGKGDVSRASRSLFTYFTCLSILYLWRYLGRLHSYNMTAPIPPAFEASARI